jgi:predicted nuclease of predicted toxin-antitoxin system
MPDDDVLAMALTEYRLLVTRDLDFGELVVRDGASSAGVVVLRYRWEQTHEMAEALARLVAKYGERLTKMFTVLGPKRARLHALARS